MRNRGSTFLLRWVSLIFIIGAIVLALLQLASYSRQRGMYPAGMTVGNVPVGGLTPQDASQRLLQVYNLPVEVNYAGAIFHVDPSLTGFDMDIESMLTAADQARTGSAFWRGYWAHIWNQTPESIDIPLRATIDEDRLRAFLENEIAPRYDTPALSAQPIPGTVNFETGTTGQELNISRAVILISDAMRSSGNRTVSLSFERTTPGRPTLANLQILFQQIIELSGFEGLVGIYLTDLQTAENLHFAYFLGQNIPVEPDIAFTASSTVKIPILVSYIRTFGTNLDATTTQMILDMIQQSENPPADALMQQIDPIRGPLVVTADMQKLGLENTFMAGYFFPGAPLLTRFSTPANQRTDIDTDPDDYNQTTISDTGILLEDIYECAEIGGGALIAVFPGEINQASCQLMVDFLSQNKTGVLIEAGVPDGTRVAHKHGWVSNRFGVIQNISNAGIVYTPGGDYVLVVFTYHPVQTIWDQVSGLITQISQATYNYFNLPAQ